EFPVVYAIAKQGRAGFAPDDLQSDLRPLLDTKIETIPAPVVEIEAPLQLLVGSLDYDSHRGRIAIGRVHRGVIRAGEMVTHIAPDGVETKQRINELWTFEGLGKRKVESAIAGDIVALAGFADARIGATITDPLFPEALPTIEIEEPTLKLTFGVNTSPFAGKEATYSTSRQLRERLYRELETNLSLRVDPTDQADVFAVSGRGELHLSVLIETMRREGYEFQVSRPEVITREVDGVVLEPVENLVIDTVEDSVGVIMDLVGTRRARMVDMVNDGRGSVRLEFAIPTRGLIGLRNAFLTATKGNAVMGSRLIGFEPWMGVIPNSRTGTLIASEPGVVLAHGVANAQERGITFSEPGEEVYAGQIVGQQPRLGDMVVNICRAKKLTNMRASTSDISIKLVPAVKLSLEQSLDFLADDELLEVTPKSYRLRKRLLNENDRAKERKRTASQH
ncbi:MAG TPA: EF-Tu/IF-2/RF-3 family GTPase, partial [Thermomicrobiales bacterium]|nr:EF-Tu/IF-2/RF-3 family GTPase [Thermomicrobiales bacterium]